MIDLIPHTVSICPIKVVHLTAHLGGGIGKAMSSLVRGTRQLNLPIEHVFICLEKPEKQLFVESLLDLGARVLQVPEWSQLLAEVASADIVQLEWWNHPATLACLAGLSESPLRLFSWCHVSGLYNPILPEGLLQLSDKVALSSPCSLQAKEVKHVAVKSPNKICVISSGSGFNTMPLPARTVAEPLALGYLGSFNFSKLHPAYPRFFASARLQGLHIRMVGDVVNHNELQSLAAELGMPHLLEFVGFTSDVYPFLSSINVMPYLLNPTHYGTAENALLEAMAMGVVPIVLDNPAECQVVQDKRTGFVIQDGFELADVLDRMTRFPEERLKIGCRASEFVRNTFTEAAMAKAFFGEYLVLLDEHKVQHDFISALGALPDEWFLSCLAQPELFRHACWDHVLAGHGRYAFLEQTKGSVFHFHGVFPDNPNLARWSHALKCANAF